MILDYSYNVLQQFPAYLGLGNAWTFNGTVEVIAAGPDPNETGIEFRPETLRLHFRPERIG